MTAKRQVARYICEHQSAQVSEIAQKLSLSTPTVLQKIKELLEDGIIYEAGVSSSTGGRKAKLFSIAAEKHCAAGINITRNHLEFVLIGLDGNIIDKKRKRYQFDGSPAICKNLVDCLREFLRARVADEEKIIGVGVSLPGIIDPARDVLIVSHALNLQGLDLKQLRAQISYPALFDNDANCAAQSEQLFRNRTALFVSLNNTVGGAFNIQGEPYAGENNKSSELGHIILVPGGRQCYCGRNGCFDSYCSAKRLSEDRLEEFFENLKGGNPEAIEKWNEYLDYLAIMVTNLRTAYDCEIILGGYVGGYLKDYLLELQHRMAQYQLFDRDFSYLSCGRFKWEASAYGAALKMLNTYYDSL